MTPEERYAALVTTILSDPDLNLPADPVESARAFASTALQVNKKIFAMLVKGRLVVKLPARRVAELVTAGEGVQFDPGHGRLMKEWLSMGPSPDEDWLARTKEAMAFVASKR